MTANWKWKSRAETMIAHLIDGEIQDAYFYSPQLVDADDNSSTSNPPSAQCAYDSVHGRLLGCDVYEGHETPCVSPFLQWARLTFGSATKAYLSSPLCLALLPLLFGMGIGFWVGRRSRTGTSLSLGHNPLGLVSRFCRWLWLKMATVLVVADPLRGHEEIDVSSGRPYLLQKERDSGARHELESIETQRESGLEPHCIPRHIAVIMDGNRRYGRAKYGNATRGHWDGSKTLLAFAQWCIAEGVQILTIYAFSTENWERAPAEVAALMALFCTYCDELRVEAVRRGIRIHVLATDQERLPADVRRGIDRMVAETRHCNTFTMNICLSYSGRGDIVNACKGIARDVLSGRTVVDRIGAADLQEKMLTGHCSDPDIVLRTSGEERLSNFLLWQVAYSEFFFLKKHWPELQKEDLLEVIRTFARGRKRRYGK